MTLKVTQRVQERKSFMATVVYNVLYHRLEMYDFTFSYTYGFFDFTAAKPELRPQWQSLYYPLSRGVWLSVILFLVFLPFTFYLVRFIPILFFSYESYILMDIVCLHIEPI